MQEQWMAYYAAQYAAAFGGAAGAAHNASGTHPGGLDPYAAAAFFASQHGRPAGAGAPLPASMQMQMPGTYPFAGPLNPYFSHQRKPQEEVTQIIGAGHAATAAAGNHPPRGSHFHPFVPQQPGPAFQYKSYPGSHSGNVGNGGARNGLHPVGGSTLGAWASAASAPPPSGLGGANPMPSVPIGVGEKLDAGMGATGKKGGGGNAAAKKSTLADASKSTGGDAKKKRGSGGAVGGKKAAAGGADGGKKSSKKSSSKKKKRKASDRGEKKEAAEADDAGSDSMMTGAMTWHSDAAGEAEVGGGGAAGERDAAAALAAPPTKKPRSGTGAAAGEARGGVEKKKDGPKDKSAADILMSIMKA
jgi:hypothetical protein